MATADPLDPSGAASPALLARFHSLGSIAQVCPPNNKPAATAFMVNRSSTGRPDIAHVQPRRLRRSPPVHVGSRPKCCWRRFCHSRQPGLEQHC